MGYSGTTKERLYRYLAEHGPSSSQEIERALNISPTAVSLILRGEPDLTKTERQSHLIFSKRQRRQRPITVRATLAENLRGAIGLYNDLRAIPVDDEPALRELAEEFIAMNVRVTSHLERLLKEEDD